jgi:hypothetical protein
MPVRPEPAPMIKFHRHAHAERAVLIDANLDLHGIDELRKWAASGVSFVVIDDETGEDVTRVLLS